MYDCLLSILAVVEERQPVSNNKKNKKLSFSKLSISLYSFFDDIHLKYTSSSQVELKLFPISSSSNFIVSFRLLKRVVLKQTRFY